jgi:uncharacterized membrane protein
LINSGNSRILRMKMGASGDSNMKTFIAAVAAAVVIAVCGWYVLAQVQEPVSVAFTTVGARI